MSCTVPISPGRTTWFWSRRNTGTRAASMSSSTCALPVWCSAFVQRLAEVSRRRCASSAIRTSKPFRSASMKLLKYLNSDWTWREPLPATLRSVWVNDREPAAAVELAEQRQRDDALPAAGAVGDDDDALVVAGPGLLDLVQNQVEGDPLLVEEDELLAPPDLLGDDLHELLAGRDRGLQQSVGDVAAVGRCEPAAEKVEELAAVAAGEEPAELVLRVVVELADLDVRGVVQVGGAGQHVGRPVERGGEVEEVLAVGAHLGHRVQDRTAAVRGLKDEFGVVLEEFGAGPLLQLEDDVGRAVSAGVAPGEDDVDPLAAQGELVLDEHLDLVQAGLQQVVGQDAQARVPGPHLGGGSAALHLERHLLGQDRTQPAARREVSETSRGGAEQRQGQSPGSTNRFVRVEACPGCGSLSGRCRDCSGPDARRAAAILAPCRTSANSLCVRLA
jgi:hypothetical protein